MRNCFNSSEIYLELKSYPGGDYEVGGVVGTTWGGLGLLLENCYNTGKVTVTVDESNSDLFTGGLTGYVYGPAKLKNSYNVGEIVFVQRRFSGLLVGVSQNNCVVENCYSLNGVANMEGIGLCSSVESGSRLTDCSELTDTYMKSEQFVEDLNNGNEEENKPWKLNPNGGYPVLWWQ